MIKRLHNTDKLLILLITTDCNTQAISEFGCTTQVFNQYAFLLECCNQFISNYCPNGLQIQGKSDIKKIISGVSANQDLIDAAIDEKTDALFVHHGFFWKNEAAEIIGIKKNRIKALLDNDINLFAYHLPLDAHPTVGNNIQLAQRFGVKNLEPIGDTLVWQGEVDTTLSQLSNTIEQALNRAPLVFGG
jgi:putative NIF3 family GTP cyclohydrolase 1 type 2